METYLQKLDDWFKKEKEEGRLGDFKLTTKTYVEHEEELGRPLTEEEKHSIHEKTAKAVYETVTGKRKSVDMTNRRL